MLAVTTAMLNMYTSQMNNSAYSMMMGANSRMSLLHTAGQMGASGRNINFRGLADADTRLETQMLMDSFNYKCSKAMLESLKKLQDENIKRSFSTFA